MSGFVPNENPRRLAEKMTQKGGHHSPETKRKMSLAKMGHPVSPETRRKISAGNHGKIRSDEMRRRMSLAKMEHPTSPETRQRLRDAAAWRHHGILIIRGDPDVELKHQQVAMRMDMDEDENENTSEDTEDFDEEGYLTLIREAEDESDEGIDSIGDGDDDFEN